MTDDHVNGTLVPIAAELVGVVRDYGPDDVAAVLARVPDGRHDALAVVLAAMVDPDKTPSQLLAWTRQPVISRDREPLQEKTNHKTLKRSSRYPREHGTERGYRQHVTRKDMPPCAKCKAAHKVREAARHVNKKATGRATVKPIGEAS